MARPERIARINALLRRPQGIGMDELMRELEVSRATINRDIETMRDQMNAPIVWDHGARKYRLGEPGRAGPTYMVPGMWLAPAQAYAYLTLHNMVEKIAPNLLGPFLEPMRGTLKQMLCDSDFQMYGLDKKIEIEMPDMPILHDLDFNALLDALLHANTLLVRTTGTSEIKGVPRKLKITAQCWVLTLEIAGGTEVEVNVADIRSVDQP